MRWCLRFRSRLTRVVYCPIHCSKRCVALMMSIRAVNSKIGSQNCQSWPRRFRGPRDRNRPDPLGQVRLVHVRRVSVASTNGCPARSAGPTGRSRLARLPSQSSVPFFHRSAGRYRSQILKRSPEGATGAGCLARVPYVIPDASSRFDASKRL